MNAPAIQVCASEFLGAEDLPADKKVGIKICDITAVPKVPGMKKKGAGDRKNKEVLLVREPGKKSMVLNPTNQWSIALLLGTKDWTQWIGHRVMIWTDIDVDIETQQRCRCLRIAGSPDATPERQAAYDKAWRAGKRERGELVRRLKRAYRLMIGPIAAPQTEEPPDDDAPPDEPDFGPSSDSPPEPPKDMGDFEEEVPAPAAAPEPPPFEEQEPRGREPGEGE